MSFNFGNTSTTGLGSTSTPAKPFGFSGPFGTPATSAPPAFGTNTFGTPTSAPAFGQQAAPQNQSSSFSFGGGSTATAQVQPLSFGANPTTQAPAFNFSTTTTSAAPAFGFGGSSTTTSQAPAFGFGASTTSTAAPAFGFGATATSTVAPSFGFGQPNPTSQAPLFGNTGFGGFGTTAAPPAFGQTNTGFSGFGQPQQQQQPSATLSPEEIFSQAIFNVSIFGDERDTTLARWNYLQALMGTGKAFYSQSQQPVSINAQNYLCRFKAMGYSHLPGKDNKMGLVALKFNKPIAQVNDANMQSQLIPKLSQLFGSKPNLMIHIDSTKALTESSSQIVIYLEEKSPNSNETKRIVATETASFLNQAHLKYQLTPLGIEDVFPIIPPDEDQLKQYLETPPKGIDPRMWRQAIVDNPDPKTFIPVPLVGFSDLKARLTCQENETSNHVLYLAKLEKDIGELKQRHANTSAKIMEHRRKFSELSHRILRIIVKQESARKAGLAVTPDEEIIRTKLENMHALVSAPTQFKGKLSELLSQLRMQRSQWALSGTSEYTLDKESVEEMKNFLTMQQRAMELLIQTVNKDLKDCKIITEGMSQISNTNH